MTIARAIEVPADTPLAAGAVDCQVEPLDVKTLPDVLGATTCTAEVPLPKTTLLAVIEVAPVPPLATGNVPLTFAVKLQYVVAAEPVPPLPVANVPVT